MLEVDGCSDRQAAAWRWQRLCFMIMCVRPSYLYAFRLNDDMSLDEIAAAMMQEIRHHAR